MGMKYTDVGSKMKDLFVQYNSILTKNGLKWVLEDNQKLAVSQVLNDVCPAALKERLDEDLKFTYPRMKKEFKDFLKHAVNVAQDFQTSHVGASSIHGTEPKNNSTNRKQTDAKNNRDKSKDMKKEEFLVFLYPPHQKLGFRHYLRDCRDYPPEERTRHVEDLASKKASDGPAHSTRSRSTTPATSRPTTDSASRSTRLTTGRISQAVSPPGVSFTLEDQSESITCRDRCDEGSDESLVSPRIAERGSLAGI